MDPTYFHITCPHCSSDLLKMDIKTSKSRPPYLYISCAKCGSRVELKTEPVPAKPS